MKEAKDAIGIGALNVDLIYELDDLSRFNNLRPLIAGSEGTTDPDEFKSLLKILEVEGKLVKKSGGGSAANAMYAMSRMGFSAGFIGKVGSDTHGDFLLKALAPVDTSRLLRDKDSGLCLCLLDQSGERSLLVLPNCNNELTFDEIDLSYLKRARFLHFSSFRGEKPFEAQKRVAEELFSRVRLSFNPGEIYVRKGFEALLPLIRASHIIFLSDKEAEILTDRAWEKAGRVLLKYGPKIVVCTRGGQGSYIFSGAGQKIFTPSEKVKVIDKTGAGDVYAAAFLAGLLLELSLEKCGKIASRAASLSITGLGRDKYPDKKFLRENLKRLKNEDEG